MTDQGIMQRWLLKIVLLAIVRISLSQEGYSYPRPEKPLRAGMASTGSSTTPRNMYQTSFGGTYQEDRSSNKNGLIGSGPNNVSPGYPEKFNGYPSNLHGQFNQPPSNGGRYSGQSQGSAAGYPRERPSIPFTGGESGIKYGAAGRPGEVNGSNGLSRSGGPSGPDASGRTGGPSRPGVAGASERSSVSRVSNGFGTPSGSGTSNGFERPSGPGVSRPDSITGSNGRNIPGGHHPQNSHNGPIGRPESGFPSKPTGNSGYSDTSGKAQNSGQQRLGGGLQLPGKGYLSPGQKYDSMQPISSRPTNNYGGTDNSRYRGVDQQSNIRMETRDRFSSEADSQRSTSGYPGSSPGLQGPTGYPQTDQRPNAMDSNGQGGKSRQETGGSYSGRQPTGDGSDRGGRPDTFSDFAQNSQSPNGYSDKSHTSTQPLNYPGMSPGFPNLSGSSSKDYSQEEKQTRDGDYSAIPGEPGRDYPIYAEIPETGFQCDAQPFPGYYADIEARCQVFHICANNKTYDFLCPNGTVFHQEFFVCVWWNQFDCNSASTLYYLNENLYDYTIMGGGRGGERFPGQMFPQGQKPTTTGFSGEHQVLGRPAVSGYPDSGMRNKGNSYLGYQGMQQRPNDTDSYTRRPETPNGQQDGRPDRLGQTGSRGSTGPFSPPSKTEISREPSSYSPPRGPGELHLKPAINSQRPDKPNQSTSADHFGSFDDKQEPQRLAMPQYQGTSSNYPELPGYFTGNSGSQMRQGSSTSNRYGSVQGSQSSKPNDYSDGKLTEQNGPSELSQPQSMFTPLKPNREYLPPRNE